ncbi:PilX N-terminal domain-containing pilus assembly protein [Planctomycetota bacterium]
MTNRNQYQGMVLLVVLGVLALMSVLAITFVQMTRLERGIARNYVDRTRAVLAAESGVEYAFAKINNFQGGALTNAEYEDMKYDPDPDNSDMAFARKASFQDAGFAKAGSGVTGSTYQDRGDYFILRVEDESGKLNLNDTDGSWNMDDDADPDPDTDDDKLDAPHRLRMLVQTLGETLFPNDPGKGALISLALFNARSQLPGSRFTDMRQLSGILVDPPAAQTPVLTKAEFQTFAEHVTLWSWQDPDVIRPTYTVELSLPDGESIPGPGDQYGVTDGGGAGGFTYQDVEDGYDSIHMYLTRDLQTKYFELEPRCPVNINTASKDLITANLTPLAGWYLQEGPASTFPTAPKFSYWELTLNTAYWYITEQKTNHLGFCYNKNLIFGKMKLVNMDADIASELADNLYNRIHVDDPATTEPDDPKPFATWQEFYQFIDRFIDDPIHPGDDPITGFSKYQADLIKANCNPNTRLNDYNLDAHIYQHIDKSQLTQYTTEFCFEPSGTFQISSLGIIKNSNNEIAADYQIYCVAELFEILRISSQAQFMEGYETEDDLINYFDESVSMTTAGAGNAAAPNGYTLQSYPEPVINLDSKPFTNPDTDRNYLDDSIYDGYLSLATWQNSRHDQVTDTYLINFNTSLEPDSDPYVAQMDSGADVYYFPYRYDFGFYFDCKVIPTARWGPPPTADAFNTNLPTVNRLTHSKDQQFLPGVLYPDGAYSGRHRCLGFNALEIGDEDNHMGMIGSLNFWIKPNFDVGLSNRPRLFFSMGQSEPILGKMANGQKLGMWYYPQGNVTNEAAISRHFYDLGNMPPRTLIFGWNGGWPPTNPGWGYHYNGVSRGTSTITHQWHDSGQAGHGLNPLYNVDAHQWSHLAISWNLYGIAGMGITSLSDFAVNGEVVTDALSGNHHADWNIPWPYITIFSFHYDLRDLTWSREGLAMRSKGCKEIAYLGGDPGGTHDYSSDSTYDDVFAHRIKLSATDNASFYSWGRYYHCADTTRNGEIARYTSPEVNLQRLFKLTPDKQIALRSISWTLYWPKTNRDADNADFYIDTQGVDVNAQYPDDPVIPDGWDPILVDVAVNDYWFYDNDKSQMPTYAGGSRPKYADGSLMRINLGRGDQFSFRVYFHMGDNTALYNAPVLDDITFTFAYISPKILSWNV